VARAGNPPIYRAKGCEVCGRNGYRGRTGIYEMLMVDDDIRQLALKNTDSSTIKRAGMKKGMRTLLDDGARKVLAGETTLAEVLSVTQEDI
jgi:Type II secretory pathway, ATPase PulE/Tfp pilus assembly pathway, ATPase PilB